MLPDSAVNKPLIAIITENSPMCLTVSLFQKKKCYKSRVQGEKKRDAELAFAMIMCKNARLVILVLCSSL